MMKLNHYYRISNLDFLCLSESWLHGKVLTSVVDVPGYNCFRKDRKIGRGGGVVVYIRDSFRCTEIEFDCDVSIECL